MCFVNLDKKIARSTPLTAVDCIRILKEAIGIHNQFLKRTDDNVNVTGTDEFHREWNFWYEQIIELIANRSSLVTRDDAVVKMQADAEIHQWYLDNPIYATVVTGDVIWQTRWRDRWLAIKAYLIMKGA